MLHLGFSIPQKRGIEKNLNSEIYCLKVDAMFTY